MVLLDRLTAKRSFLNEILLNLSLATSRGWLKKMYSWKKNSTLLQQEKFMEQTNKSFSDHLGTIPADFKWLLRFPRRPQAASRITSYRHHRLLIEKPPHLKFEEELKSSEKASSGTRDLALSQWEDFEHPNNNSIFLSSIFSNKN